MFIIQMYKIHIQMLLSASDPSQNTAGLNSLQIRPTVPFVHYDESQVAHAYISSFLLFL